MVCTHSWTVVLSKYVVDVVYSIRSYVLNDGLFLLHVYSASSIRHFLSLVGIGHIVSFSCAFWIAYDLRALYLHNRPAIYCTTLFLLIYNHLKIRIYFIESAMFLQLSRLDKLKLKEGEWRKLQSATSVPHH